jgi:hypothetical protein
LSSVPLRSRGARIGVRRRLEQSPTEVLRHETLTRIMWLLRLLQREDLARS